MITVSHLSKTYKTGSVEFPVLKNISFTVEKGDFVAITGKSGSGKSTLLYQLSLLDTPTSGTVTLNGTDAWKLTDAQRVSYRLTELGYVFQDYALVPELTTEENVSLLPMALGNPDEVCHEVSVEILDVVGLKERLSHLPRELSGGEQQRVAIARALVIKPRILQLAEPLSALDAITHKKMRNELARIPMLTGVSVIHITHHAEDLISLGHRTAVMDNGAIVQIGSPDEIFQNPKTPFVAAFTGMENLFSGIAMDSHEGKVIRIGQVKIHVITPYTGPVQCGIRPDAVSYTHLTLPTIYSV